ncbi:MAG: YdcF family protein [Saccharospirillum sp.]|nr:YdcF family protein [Saccharospirillum sp.]
MILRYLAKLLLLPPAINLLMMFTAALLWQRFPRLARNLLAVAVVSLWLLSTPWISQQLSRVLEQYPALSFAQLAELDRQAQAIVILAGGMEATPQELGYAAPDSNTLMRLRYGAFLHRQTGLPILVSGGRVFDSEGPTLADAMALDLAQSFQVSTRWRETRSRTTAENAQFSAEMLLPEGVRRIALVTESFHMPRSVLSFEQAGFEVIAAPTRLPREREARLLDWVPNAQALQSSSQTLHEWLGLIVYRWL